MENILTPLPAIHSEQVAGRSATVRKQLILLSNTLNANTFDAADLLFEADESGYIREWGFKNLGEYAEKELGIKERKSQYLCRIVRICKAVGLTRAQYEPAGVSKLREITRLDPNGTWFNPETKVNEPLADHIIDLIVDAPELSRKDVTEEVLKLQGMVGGARPIVRSFSCPQDAWTRVINVAMEQMRMKMGSAGRDDGGIAKEYSDGAVLECICADWLSGNEIEENIEVPTESTNELEKTI